MTASANRSGNIVLTGFMGTGKTAVGRLLAEHLGWDFVDTDALIESRHGHISTIFAELGEPAFRGFEREVAQELSTTSHQVIATGGGLMLDPRNVASLGATGPVYCLTAETDEILRRLLSSRKRHRPLLESPDPAARIVELLTERAEAYSAFEQISTDHQSPADIATELADRHGGAGTSADEFGDQRC